jgi:hypothetical protein
VGPNRVTKKKGKRNIFFLMFCFSEMGNAKAEERGESGKEEKEEKTEKTNFFELQSPLQTKAEKLFRFWFAL